MDGTTGGTGAAHAKNEWFVEGENRGAPVLIFNPVPRAADPRAAGRARTATAHRKLFASLHVNAFPVHALRHGFILIIIINIVLIITIN